MELDRSQTIMQFRYLLDDQKIDSENISASLLENVEQKRNKEMPKGTKGTQMPETEQDIAFN